jgi:hypothetical protein
VVNARHDDRRERARSSLFGEKSKLKVNVQNCATHRIHWCVALTVVLLAVLPPVRIDAQVPASRWFASLGGGYGKSGPAQSLGADQFTGPTGDLTVGATVTSRGMIGLEVAGWQKDTPIGSSRSTFVTLTLIGHPFGSVLDNLFFQGGVGVGHGSFPVHSSASTVARINLTHPSLQVAFGYDIPIACPLWISPYVQSYGTFGGHKIDAANLGPNAHESANGVLFFAGVALKYVHPGPAGHCQQRSTALTQ